jgi:hypothetical protein
LGAVAATTAAVDLGRRTSRTDSFITVAGCDRPIVAATAAVEAKTVLRVDRAALNTQTASFGQCCSNLAMSRLQDPPEGGPRDAHAFGSLLVVEPFTIGKADTLEFIEGELDLLTRDPRGFEEGYRGARAHAAANLRTRHG